MIFDAATLISFFDRDDRQHWEVVGEVDLVVGTEALVVSPFVIAELEPIVTSRYGPEGWRAALTELAGGAWTIAPVDAEHLTALCESAATGASLAQASAAVLLEQEAARVRGATSGNVREAWPRGVTDRRDGEARPRGQTKRPDQEARQGAVTGR